MQLTQPESDLSFKLFHKVRNFITEDLLGNVWDVDVPAPHAHIKLDLVCDFLGRGHMAVKGRVWIECKQLAAAGFRKRLGELEEELPLKLQSVRMNMPSISSVMLLLTKNDAKYGDGWAEPGMVC